MTTHIQLTNWETMRPAADLVPQKPACEVEGITKILAWHPFVSTNITCTECKNLFVDLAQRGRP